jgi:quercetin dioxygenase-like cupin family protein
VDAFRELGEIAPQDIWDAVAVRAIYGERLTLGVVELDPGSVVPEHRHENEQLGMVLTGSLTFRVGDESRQLGPGGTWSIPPNVPHEVAVGPDGAVVVDVFTPPRDDWQRREPRELRAPRWP